MPGLAPGYTVPVVGVALLLVGELRRGARAAAGGGARRGFSGGPGTAHAGAQGGSGGCCLSVRPVPTIWI